MYGHRYFENQYTHYAWTPDYPPYANYYPAGYYYHPYSPALPTHYSTGYVTPNKQQNMYMQEFYTPQSTISPKTDKYPGSLEHPTSTREP